MSVDSLRHVVNRFRDFVNLFVLYCLETLPGTVRE